MPSFFPIRVVYYCSSLGVINPAGGCILSRPGCPIAGQRDIAGTAQEAKNGQGAAGRALKTGYQDCRARRGTVYFDGH